MDFFLYLNTKLKNTEYKSVVSNLINIPADRINIFEENQPVIQLGDKNIFSYATQEDLDSIDYSKLLAKNEDFGAEYKLSPLEYVIKEFFSFETIKNKVDKDSDGEITPEEAKKYLEQLASADGDNLKLTADDFNKVLEDNKVELLAELEKYSQAQSEQEYESDNPYLNYDNFTPLFNLPSFSNIEFTFDPANIILPQMPVGGLQSNTGMTSYGNYGSNPVYRTSKPFVKTIYNMTLNELMSEKSKREEKLTTANNLLKNAQKEQTDELKSANKKVSDAKKAYENSLNKDEAAKPFKKAVEKNNSETEKNQKVINKIAVDISDKKAEVSKKEYSVSIAEAVLTSLTKSLSSLPKKNGDNEHDSKISKKENELKEKISKQKKQADKDKKALKDSQNELAKLNEKQKELEKNAEKLAEEKKQLDNRIEKYCSENTNKILKEYNNAVKNAKDLKNKAVSKAESEVKNSYKSVKEVNDIIISIKSRSISEKAERAAQIAEQEFEKGVREIGSSNDSAEIRKYKNGVRNSNPWCASFVSYCFGAGQNSKNEETFGYTASSQEIKRRGNQYYAHKNSGYRPQRGDVAMWTDADGAHGHTGIVTESFDDGSFVVIEGNKGNAVKRTHYKSVDDAGRRFNGFVKMNEWTA